MTGDPATVAPFSAESQHGDREYPDSDDPAEAGTNPQIVTDVENYVDLEREGREMIRRRTAIELALRVCERQDRWSFMQADEQRTLIQRHAHHFDAWLRDGIPAMPEPKRAQVPPSETTDSEDAREGL